MHRIIVTALAACGMLVPLARPAFADSVPGGVRIIVQRWTPTNPASQSADVVLDRPRLLSDALNEGWSLARKPVCNALAAEAGKPDRLGSGMTLYNIDCTMAQSGALTVTGHAGNSVTMTFRLPGNMFKATSTQPSVAGSYADPCVFLYYDLSAKTTLHLDTLAVDAFSVAIDNVSRPDSCNAAGDIAKYGAAVVRFFGGPDFLAMAQHAIERTQDVSTSKLNAAVSSFVGPVRQYANRYAKQQSWVRHGDLFFAFSPSYTPQPLSASMGGAIRMRKDRWSAAAPDCSTFTITGSVQTGPAVITDPERLDNLSSPPTADVGMISASGAAVDFGDRYECAYTERQLPAGVPVTFRGTGRVGIAQPKQRGHVIYPVSVKPDGWSGVDTIAAFDGGKNFIAAVAPELVGFEERARQPVIVDPGDPARGYAAPRVNPIPLQASNVAAPSIAARVSLNPQPLPPKGSDPWTVSGNALFSRGDFAGAAAAFGHALDANAGNAVALHNLGLAHARLGQADRAKGELIRAAQLARRQGDAGTADASDRAIIIVGGRQQPEAVAPSH